MPEDSDRLEREAPTAGDLVKALGANSPAFRSLLPLLSDLYRQTQEAPEAAVRYREWRACLSRVHGDEVGDEPLFLRHTYLSLAARFVDRLFLEPNAGPYSPAELADTVNGNYFREQALDNFIEDDFFTWPLKVPEVAQPAFIFLHRLAQTLTLFDFGRAGPDLLPGLYQDLIAPEGQQEPAVCRTPDWLAEYLLSEELGLARSPDQRVLDPCCGSGAFLYAAIRLIARARASRGEDQFDVLINLLDQVMGMDLHPVAVTIARVNYLMALGDLVKGVHPPILVPVYLSDALTLPDRAAGSGPSGGYPEPVYTVETSQPGVVFELPHSVVTNLEMLDWLFARLPNYLRGAELRSLAQSEEQATQEVINAFHNYLVSPKPRTPIPEPLGHFAAGVMEQTASKLVHLALSGQDHLWLFVLKNRPASVYLAQRKFDLVVGNPPWDSSGYRLPNPREPLRPAGVKPSSLFFARCADLYLQEGGRIGMVLPRSALFDRQRQETASLTFNKDGQEDNPPGLALERVLDLEGIPQLFSAPSVALVARRGGETIYPIPGAVFEGVAPDQTISWEAARAGLRRRPASFG